MIHRVHIPSQPGKKDTPKLSMQDDRDGNTNIDGLMEVPVFSAEDIFALLKLGEMHRNYGETKMNERSSRSHTIFRWD